MPKCLKDIEILEKYKNRKYFYKLLNKDKEIFNNFILYIYKHFNLNLSFEIEYKNNYTFPEFVKFILDNKYDKYIYIYLQKITTCDKVKEFVDNKYIEILESKIKSLDKFIPLDIKKNIKKILDIGTEDIRFIEMLKTNFKTENVEGLNIRNDLKSYSGNIRHNKIQIYDGMHFKFINNVGEIIYSPNENEYDLVIIISIMHHIKQKKLQKWIKNMCKITKSIYIKDNNIGKKSDSSKYIKIQHELYEGVLYPQNINPLNIDLTMDFIIEELNKNNFRIIKYTPDPSTKPYFSKSFELFAIKKSYL